MQAELKKADDVRIHLLEINVGDRSIIINISRIYDPTLLKYGDLEAYGVLAKYLGDKVNLADH